MQDAEAVHYIKKKIILIYLLIVVKNRGGVFLRAKLIHLIVQNSYLYVLSDLSFVLL